MALNYCRPGWGWPKIGNRVLRLNKALTGSDFHEIYFTFIKLQVYDFIYVHKEE